jgi:hypothetical protein
MQLRRSLALVSGTLLLTASLASCGFDPATDRVNTITPGTSDRDGTVDVLNAVIVSAEEGSGVLVTTLVNNDNEEEATLDSVAADDDTVQVGEFSAISIDPNGLVNLAAEDEGGIPVEGELAAGDVVPLTLQLSGGQVVQLDVPVVWNCQEFEGIDGEGGDCEVAEPEEH